MKYKYHSILLNKQFDTVKELETAEKEFKQKQEELAKRREEELKELEAKRLERQVRAKEVEEAYEKLSIAKQEASKLLNAFIKDYGSYHSTVRKQIPLGESLIEFLFGFNPLI